VSWGPCAQQKGLQRHPQLGSPHPTLRWYQAAEIPGLVGVHHSLELACSCQAGRSPCLPVAPGSGCVAIGDGQSFLPRSGLTAGRGGQADEHGNLDDYSVVIIDLNTERGGEGGESWERGEDPWGKAECGEEIPPLHRHGKGAGWGQGERWKGSHLQANPPYPCRRGGGCHGSACCLLQAPCWTAGPRGIESQNH